MVIKREMNQEKKEFTFWSWVDDLIHGDLYGDEDGLNPTKVFKHGDINCGKYTWLILHSYEK